MRHYGCYGRPSGLYRGIITLVTSESNVLSHSDFVLRLYRISALLSG